MTRRLIEDGYEVDEIDIAWDPVPESIHDFGWWMVEDARHFFVDDDHHGPYDLVVHCAAVVGGREMIDGSPLHVAAENLSIDADLFRWALRTRPGRIVYFSSSAAYPTYLQNERNRFNLRERWVDPETRCDPDQTYGWVKLTGERLAHDANAEGIKTHVFRPFSGYGEDQSLDYPFPSFIDRAVRRADPFDIWGDGTQVRDWIHVDDIVGGVMAAIEQDVLGPVNLGTGIGTSMMELAAMTSMQAWPLRPVPKVKTHPDKPSGVQYRVADITKMSEFYTPKVTLEEGIQRALKAHADH